MQKPHLVALLISLSVTAVADTVDVYFGTSGGEAQGIYHATLETDTGRLSRAVLAAESGDPGFLALNSRQDRLYAVASEGEPVVVSYRVGDGGGLERLNAEPIGDGRGAHIAVHPSDRFLLTAQYGGGSVAVFPLAGDGSVGKRAQIVEHEGGSNVVPDRQGRPHPHWVGYSPDGNYALVPDLGKDQVVIYRLDAGVPSITPHGLAQSVAGGGPRHMRFSTDGRFIYLLNELTLSVSTFAWDASHGTAEPVASVPALSERVKAREAFNSASEIVVHPNGRFVYSANRGHDSVTVYEASPDTGLLTVREVEPVRGSWPRNINLDPTGKWLLAAGAHSGTVAVFAIDQDNGELTFQTRGVINVPGAFCIVFRK
jgi:6-phosphogluconolactonase